jgi:hypothetical protein
MGLYLKTQGMPTEKHLPFYSDFNPNKLQQTVEDIINLST